MTTTGDGMAGTLDELRDQVQADLRRIRHPDRRWVPPRTSPQGTPLDDVVIVGAGHCGLTVAFGLLRKGVDRIRVLEARPAGRQGPWNTYGRMRTLRSPKHFNGPDLDVPSLTFEAWFRARFGDAAWEQVHKIPTAAWQDYLQWFREVLDLPVEYETSVERVRPEGGALRVDAVAAGGAVTYRARKVVFATGAEGSGEWAVPEGIEALPRERWAQVAEPIDFTRLAGARVAVLGGGASAYDNAAEALEAGARSVQVFFHRPRLHRVNPHKWTEFAGFLEHLCDLDDALRWRFMRHILPLNEPPPPESFRRAACHRGFRLHLGEPWTLVSDAGDRIEIRTPAGRYEVDFALVAIGLRQDLRVRPELAEFERYVARWADRYDPPPEERHEGLARFPYLGPHLEYVEREPGQAPFLRDIYNFTAAATVSHGPSGASINGMKEAARRLVDGIVGDLFVADAEALFQSLQRYDTAELDVPEEEVDRALRGVPVAPGARRLDRVVDSVVFDIGGVLVDWDPRYLYRSLLADEAAVEAFLSEVCTGAWNREQDRGRPFSEAVKVLSERFPEHQDLIAAYRCRWPEMIGGLFEDAVAILDDLHGAGVPLYALTNWSAETFEIVRERYDFLKYFRGVVVSGEEGAVKPEPAIYRRMLDRYRLDAERTLFVDDSPANVEGARRAGMPAVRYHDAPTLRADLAALGLRVPAASAPGHGR